MHKTFIKLKKIISIILFNIIAIVTLWFISDVCLYITSLKLNNQLSFQNLKKFYKKPNNPYYVNDFFCIDNNSEYRSRKPVGLQYKSPPILLFGCSYAYGSYLGDNQNFGHKLSNQIQVPVFNRAIPGCSLQHMYYQTTTLEFYKSVLKCDTVVYVIISDHFRRMLGEVFNIYENSFYMHYKYKNRIFIMDNYKDFFAIFYKYNYTLRAIRKIYYYFYLKNPKNYDKITDEALAYFIKTRENLENHWHNKINFVVLFYGSCIYENILMNKLKENKFIIISTNDLTKEDIYSRKYKFSDNHPNEAAWDLLTPLFVQKMKQEKVF
ncbi:hypothetical protein IJG14_01615 [bacterium]|nr:hypothetical protein [bacterium]